MIKILSLLAILSSVFYSPSINALSVDETENHWNCESGNTILASVEGMALIITTKNRDGIYRCGT